MTDMNCASKKIALITGANKGIGFETARQLAEKGMTVILGGRDLKAVKIAAEKILSMGYAADYILLDITSSEHIHAALDTINEKYGRLDILVNNAAIRIEHYGLNPSEQPMQKWRDTFNTNLFGMVELTVALLPLIKKSNAGRIVNVSSLLASITTHTDQDSYAYSPMFKSLPAYSAAKSAVNSWTIHLAYELRDTVIKVNAVHPGYTITDMNDGAGDLDVSAGALTSVQMATLDNSGPSGTFTHMGNTIGW
ncbi:SDR family oxidoreductase [Serratia sp. NPDC078593]|uniref:SDR family oxidoreductase n=1 Tax=unclassified Serratia (in: enterobacteria) TaxID=2647522 RepID=UPI0037D64961